MTTESMEQMGPESVPPRISGAPEWLESTLHVTAGRDPLGFQTITTDRIIPRLVPGVLALSRRARYFSFYAFLIDDYRRRQLGASNNGLSIFMKRREYELALAVELCPVGHRNEAVASNGRERAGPAVSRGDAMFGRNESVDSYLGGYGLYYRSPMIDLGLVAPRGTPFGEGEGATPVDVLWPNDERAEALADAFRAAIGDTEYFGRYYASHHDIPREVLVDYARRACLCRLPEFPDERQALRQALLVASERQPAHDVTRRREAFAFLLWLAELDERVVRFDAPFRDRIWDAHEQERTAKSETLRTTGARWAALIAKEFAQEGISSIWARVCQIGLAASGASGIAAADLDERLIGPLIAPVTLEPFGQSIAVGPETPTATLRSGVLATANGRSLEELRGWAVRDGSAMAGLALLLAVDGRVSALGQQPPGWAEIASQDGERQPGLAHLGHRLAEHLRTDPTVRVTMSWIVRTLVLWPHELIAYSKLPQSTFRFRWESGRLRFYDLRPERFGMTDARRDALGRLGADVGLFDWTANGAVPTTEGRAFVTEVFG
ncbi:MAG: hypothetical protein HY262_09540 [Chloroflexi bacterium]|nr:hypothetical protein [Chloroflexota bacterium]